MNTWTQTSNDDTSSSTYLHSYFSEHIQPLLYPLEKLRLNQMSVIRARIITSLFLVIPALALSWWLFLKFGEKISDILGFLNVLLITALYKWAYRNPSNLYRTTTKFKIMPIVSKLLGDFTYTVDGKIDPILFDNSHIIPRYDEYVSEDYIQGVYHDTEIQMAEVVLREKRSNGKNTQMVKVFQGICIAMKMKKSFFGQTLVKKDHGSFLRMFQSKDEGFQKVILEDVKFENIFEVYSTDQVEARYILTTAFMERILQVADIFKSTGIQCSFFEKHMFLMLPLKKNMFEPHPVYKKVLEYKDIVHFAAEMQSIFRIVDILKMNQDIGM